MFKPHYTPLALVLGSLLSAPSFADDTTVTDTDTNSDDIVISASRVETSRVETGSSITVLDAQYIKDNQARTVAELLQDVPGVSVANSGSFGQPTSVFIRGANSGETLVIIDGVEVNDLSSSSGSYDFAHLMADNIERIEVLRGSQSALWGSDAMGGVINIITKKGKAGFNPTASIEIGENNYHKENVSISGATDASHYSLAASNIKTDGISATTVEGDDDNYENQSLNLKAGHQFNNLFAMDTILRYSNVEYEYDNPYGSDYDSGYHATNLQRQAKLNANLNLLNKQWQNRLSIAFSDSDREDFSSSDSEYKGQKIKTDLQSNYYFDTINDFTQHISVIAEHENNKYEYGEEYKMDASAAVLAYGVDWQKAVFINAAIRGDFNSKFDDTTTYHLDLSAWVNDGTRLHASYGTGSKNPTFYQLYSDYYGNTDLASEESRSWDAGVEYNFSDVNAYIDLTYFDSHYTDMIDTECDAFWNCTFYNVDEATANGVELTGSLKLTKDFRMSAGYTYMETDNGDGDELVRRPKHSASINANYKYTPTLSANIGARYVGDRDNSDYDDVRLDSYTVTNIGATYQVHKHITLTARLENAFDENYEEVSGYNTAERTAYVGVSFQ